jgi:hypothetical protein
MNEAARSGRVYPWRIVGGMTGLVAILAIMTFSQANFQDEDAEANQVLSGGAFGYADPEGKRVLTPVETGLARGMKRFSKVVAAPGRVVEASFVAARRAGDEGTGRLEPEAFDEAAGAVFAAGEALPGGENVLVATERFLAEREVLTVTPLDHPDCAPQTAAALAARAGRAVAWCKDLATVGEEGRLSLARFAPRGHDELVTLAYSGTGGPVYRDLPALADPEGTWRTGDGGEFSVANYRPLFAFRSRSGLEVAVRWSGADGEAMDLYRQEGQAFAPFVAATRLRADEERSWRAPE